MDCCEGNFRGTPIVSWENADFPNQCIEGMAFAFFHILSMLIYKYIYTMFIYIYYIYIYIYYIYTIYIIHTYIYAIIINNI